MKTPLLAALAAVAALSTAASAQQTRALDPVGSYSVTTTSETGQPLNGKLTITAGERYGGTFTSPALPQPIKIESVATNARQIMITMNNGQGIVLVWIELQADGTFKGTWHQLGPAIAATGKKDGGE